MTQNLVLTRVASGTNWSRYVHVTSTGAQYHIFGHRWAGGAHWTVEGAEDGFFTSRSTRKAVLEALADHLAKGVQRS